MNECKVIAIERARGYRRNPANRRVELFLNHELLGLFEILFRMGNSVPVDTLEREMPIPVVATHLAALHAARFIDGELWPESNAFRTVWATPLGRTAFDQHRSATSRLAGKRYDPHKR